MVPFYWIRFYLGIAHCSSVSYLKYENINEIPLNYSSSRHSVVSTHTCFCFKRRYAIWSICNRLTGALRRERNGVSVLLDTYLEKCCNNEGRKDHVDSVDDNVCTGFSSDLLV